MVWYNPLSWFSKSTQTAKAIANNANTNVLKSALRNYIKAVNNLPNKNNAHIYGLMMKTANGANASYKNRMVNGIAKIVAASRRGLTQAAVAVANGAPEGAAAAAVNNATANINSINASINAANANSLNKIMAKLIKNSGGTLNANGNPAAWAAPSVAKAYVAVRKNKLAANKNKNTTRTMRGRLGRTVPAPARWKAIFNEANKEIQKNSKEVNLPNGSKAVLVKVGNMWRFENGTKNVNYRIVGANTNNPTVGTKANLNAAKAARAKAAAERLWGLAGTGTRNIGTAQKTAATIARNNGSLNVKNLTRADLNAVLANTSFSFGNNNRSPAGARNAEHVKRVKNLLNHLGLTN